MKKVKQMVRYMLKQIIRCMLKQSGKYMLIFIDESGDQGFNKGSSAYMVFAMVIFKNGADALAADKAIAALKSNGIKRREFKFRSSTNNVRDAFFALFKERRFDIRAVVIEKQKFSQISNNFESQFSRGQKIYFFGLSKLLFSYPIKAAKIRLDQKDDHQLKLFLESHNLILNAQNLGSIRESLMKKSEEDNLIQLADMVTGAIARSYDPNKRDHDRWRKALNLKQGDVIEII